MARVKMPAWRRRARRSQRYHNNKDTERANNKRWRLANPDKVRASKKRWRAANPKAVQKYKLNRVAAVAEYYGISKWHAWDKLKAFSKACRKEVGHCMRCGATDNLTLHHIAKVAIRPDLAFEYSNVRVLCRPCHLAEEARY